MLFSKKIIGSLNRPKTSAAEAEGRLLKSFGIGQLCSALVIVCTRMHNVHNYTDTDSIIISLIYSRLNAMTNLGDIW